MLFLKAANFEDLEKEFEFITNIPKNENGFTNPHFNCSKEDFKNRILPNYIKFSNGIDLPENWVPETEYFLWDDNQIVGLFRLRHFLNDFLANGAGHIGYSIKKEFRGKGYASKGLALTIQEAWKVISENEIYMSVSKTNLASLKVQLKNGAYIHHENDHEIFTRIKNPHF